MQNKFSDNQCIDLTIKKELGIATAEDIQELELIKRMSSLIPEYLEKVWREEALKVMKEKGIEY